MIGKYRLAVTIIKGNDVVYGHAELQKEDFDLHNNDFIERLVVPAAHHALNEMASLYGRKHKKVVDRRSKD